MDQIKKQPPEPAAPDRTKGARIDVCVCTFKRPHLLLRLLESLKKQETQGRLSFEVVVVDNDPAGSAKTAVEGVQAPFPVHYLSETVPNIANARNRAVSHGSAEYLAFIDDDEFPEASWLLTMFDTCNARGVAGVLGPVLPHFDSPPPSWLVKAGFYDRARHPTGFVLGWQEARTGNVLLRRSLLAELGVPFNSEFGNGGEDQDFFRRLMEKGHTFIWCDEAPAYETVPENRWGRGFLLRRAFLRGQTTHLHGRNRLKNAAKSLIAIPAYAAMLPVLVLAGHHLFMRYLVKMCDHLGRVLALVNLNPVKERNH